MNRKKLLLDDEMLASHSRKLKYWFNLLDEVMPDYFFNTFTTQQIEEILPALFNLEKQHGVQRIVSEDSVILIYLKSDENNLVSTARMMRQFNIVGAVIHMSKQTIVIDGVPRTLIIELYQTKAASFRLAPIYSDSEIKRAYKKRYRKANPDLQELCCRVNWNAVEDLTVDRLVERLDRAIKVQGEDWIDSDVEKVSRNEYRLTISLSNTPQQNFYHCIIEALALYDFNVDRAYLREITYQENPENLEHMPVSMLTIYFESDPKSTSIKAKRLEEMLWDLPHIKWVPMDDLIHSELVDKKRWSLAKANLLRAAGDFVHTQFSFIDRNAYNNHDIYRFMVLYEGLLHDLFRYFELKFKSQLQPDDKKLSKLDKKISASIAAINTGMREKDMMIKNIFGALLDFFQNLKKCNYYVPKKTALAFRLEPDFMHFYEKLATSYSDAFPENRPHGIFYFSRANCVGFQIRFSEIARGGWRTVVPRNVGHELEKMDSYSFAKDEVFREVYVLAHTQHLKNKDIYEGGSKMICLLRMEDKFEQKKLLEAQRSVCRSFLDIINCDSKGKLKDKTVVDYLGRQEIIEIGPDENMYDVMINWIGDYSQKVGYILGGGLISGKPESGVNHKEHGVTSFGVHQFVLKALEELGLDPVRDPFSIKISGGPYGDVAGNEVKLVLEKKNGKYIYPKVKIVAITDGPAAAYDPDGLDKKELESMVKCKNLDAFSPEKLTGDGAYIVFSEAKMIDEVEKYRFFERRRGKLIEKMISRDEFMSVFQNNLMRNYADIFIPCGGRPSTINEANWCDYLLEDGSPSSKAIVEGANSFLTPEAREKVQKAGVWIVKDASANKCGVITSSYEILSGLLLTKDEFKENKDVLVSEIMEILRKKSRMEADWLFHQLRRLGGTLTELTERLSYEINAKNEEINSYLIEHSELSQDDIVLQHLPPIFSKLAADRLGKLPPEYRKAIVAVELACRVIYNRTRSLEQEIAAVIK